jgi:hypothetical protein
MIAASASLMQPNVQAVLASKQRALAATASGRLAAAIPQASRLLEAAFRRGESAPRRRRLNCSAWWRIMAPPK